MAVASATLETGRRLPMAEEFFARAIASHSLVHAYVLKGGAYGSMYNLALRIAQLINCQNPPEALPGMPLSAMACNECTACKWVARNAHPGVLTISRLTYQVSDKGDDLTPDDLEKLAKKGSQATQIKAEQIERLLAQLSLSSEHTRVIIFTDAEELPGTMPSDAIPPCEWAFIEANEEKSFHIRPLERRLFNHASANRFLKTLEEPLPNTMFFFIAETEEQLLETIVSRCQVVPCLAEGAVEFQFDAFPPEYFSFLDRWSGSLRQGRDFYALAAEFEDFFVSEGGLSHVQALEVFQAFLRRGIQMHAQDPASFAAYRKMQHSLDTARRMLESKTNESQSLLNLFVELSEK